MQSRNTNDYRDSATVSTCKIRERRSCSGWRVTPESLPILVATQTALVAGASGAVRPGGLLVYSTCSLESEENEAVVAAFLKGRTDFQLEGETLTHPEAGVGDGGYFAVLGRRGDS